MGTQARVAKAKWMLVAQHRAAGMSPTEISRLLGCTSPPVHGTLDEPSVQAEVRRIQDGMRREAILMLRSHASTAIAGLVALAKETDLRASSARARACCELLDRSGLTAESALEQDDAPVVATDPATLKEAIATRATPKMLAQILRDEAARSGETTHDFFLRVLQAQEEQEETADAPEPA